MSSPAVPPLRVWILSIAGAIAVLSPSSFAAPESTIAAASAAIVVKGEVGPRAVPVKAFKAEVKTALLAAQPAPGIAGAALSATVRGKVVPLAANTPGELAYVSPATQTFQPALNAVSQQIQLRHRGWFTDKRIEFSIDEPVAPADIASGTLAIFVAMDAMIMGWTPDPEFVALGTLQADGQIAAVKQPIPRLLAAYRAGGQRIAVPDRMWAQVADLLVAEGVASFSKVQMFTVNSLEELPGLAMNPPNPEVERAANRFADVQRALQTPGADADAELLKPSTKDALREVLTIMPSHLTARLLLGRTTGQYKILSLAGSVAAIEAMGATLLKAVRSNTPQDMTLLPAAAVTAESERLRGAKAKLDPKAYGVLAAVLAYADVARSYHERPAASTMNKTERNRVLYGAAKQVRDELAKVAPPS